MKNIILKTDCTGIDLVFVLHSAWNLKLGKAFNL